MSVSKSSVISVKPHQQLTATRIVTTSFIVSILDVLLNITTAVLSGSVIMVSQSLEAVADLVSAGMLLIGITRSKQPSDRNHPFGYGREAYFWTMLSALIMLGITATLSFYFGLQRLLQPHSINNILITFAVLVFGLLTNSYSLSLSFRRLLRGRNPAKIWGIFFRSSLIETKTTFVLDLMGTVAPLLGIISLTIYALTGDVRFDGLGAMAIGITLGVLSYFLLVGVKDLLIGKSASLETEEKIRLAVFSVPEVQDIIDLKTLHIGPEKLLVNIDIHVKDKLTTDEIERLIDTIEAQIKNQVPSVNYIQIELETPKR